MKIAGHTPLTATAPVAGAEPVGNATPAQPVQPAATPNESDVLKPAQAALQSMGEVDLEKVAFLRDALARGDIPFDADRLARLVQRFHGGH